MKNSNLQKNSINLLEGDLLKLFCYCIEANKGKKDTSPQQGDAEYFRTVSKEELAINTLLK